MNFYPSVCPSILLFLKNGIHVTKTIFRARGKGFLKIFEKEGIEILSFFVSDVSFNKLVY